MLSLIVAAVIFMVILLTICADKSGFVTFLWYGIALFTFIMSMVLSIKHFEGLLGLSLLVAITTFAVSYNSK